MVAGAAVLQTAYMYVDQPARFALMDQAPTTSPPEAVNSDFQSTTWLSSEGAFMGTSISEPQGCAAGAPVTGSGPRRLVSADYPTIQAAIDAADPGDVVFVAAGTYHENLRLRSNVSLVGSGATTTTLDGGGAAVSLVDYSGARNVVLQGFTLTGVGEAAGCSQPDDVFDCGGNWYAAAIFGDGHATAPGTNADPCADTSILVTQNIIRDNFIGMMSYFHARAVVSNNLFLGNQNGFVANHMQDHALLSQNAFFDNQQLAVGSQAAYLDVIGNIVVGSGVGVNHEFIQTGRISCNAFAQVGNVGDRVPIGEQGNLVIDQAFVDSAGGDFSPIPALVSALVDCLGGGSDLAPWSTTEPGAFGGVLGLWN